MRACVLYFIFLSYSSKRVKLSENKLSSKVGDMIRQ